MENKQKVENVNDHEETKYQPEEKENVDPEATTSKEVSPYYWRSGTNHRRTEKTSGKEK